MTYVIRNQDHTIKTFCQRADDNILTGGETLEVSPLSFMDYANRFTLSLNGKSGETIRIAKGSANQVISVSAPGENNVDIDVNGNISTCNLTGGIGSFSLDTTVAGTYLLRPADRTKFCAAGESILVIEVTE